jgi:hypothetical protein
MRFDFSAVLNLRAVVGAIAIAILALVVTFIWIEWSAPPPASGDVIALLTVIPAPSGTPLPPLTPTFDPNAPTPTPALAPGQIAIGSYVQIKGTDGLGLRIRSAPGLAGNQLFLGYDAEVFVVNDGPRQADGYTWYSLVAPYDATRTGWAASDFFTIIPPPQN